tara:strand:+ start:8485 stop:9069 length:585 start_codon:yes stop_codon:yes gene_type:complete
MASILSVEQLQGLAAGSTPNTITIPSGQTLYAPGHVINTYQATKTDVQAVNNFAMVDVTGLSITLTPKSASSKFLIHYRVPCSGNYFTTYLNLLRDTTILGANADGAGDNRLRVTSCHVSDQTISNSHGIMHVHTHAFLDSPATTNQITYKIQTCSRGSGNSHVNYINRSVPDRAQGEYDARTISTMVIQEIAQ